LKTFKWSFSTGQIQQLCKTATVEVVSGVPQGSVIGPTSLVSIVNDLLDVVLSKLYMFADDTKMHSRLVSDCQQLQSDIGSDWIIQTMIWTRWSWSFYVQQHIVLSAYYLWQFRLSVHLSHAGIVFRQIKTGSCGLQCEVAKTLDIAFHLKFAVKVIHPLWKVLLAQT